MARFELFRAYDVVLFDLDNTLYAEKDYLHAAYRAIGEHLHRHNPLLSSEEISNYLMSTFEQKGREGLFDECLRKFEITKIAVPELLTVMRTVRIEPQLQLYPQAQEMLIQALHRCKVFIITNGNVEQQENKVNQIDWCGLRKHIDVLYANSIAAKPSPASFLSLQIPAHLKCIYIGDSEVDQLFARHCQIDFEFIQHFSS